MSASISALRSPCREDGGKAEASNSSSFDCELYAIFCPVLSRMLPRGASTGTVYVLEDDCLSA